jgi:hypothetical protein
MLRMKKIRNSLLNEAIEDRPSFLVYKSDRDFT